MITLRPMAEDDLELYLKWVRPESNFDSAILRYPLLATMVAQNGKPLVMLPTHPVLMLESIAHDPDSDLRDRIEAMDKLLEAAEKYAKLSGIAELVFLASDEKIATAAKRRDFRESGLKVLRKSCL